MNTKSKTYTLFALIVAMLAMIITGAVYAAHAQVAVRVMPSTPVVSAPVTPTPSATPMPPKGEATPFDVLFAALPQCASEDSTNCAWHAGQVGDTFGDDFVSIADSSGEGDFILIYRDGTVSTAEELELENLRRIADSL